MAALRNWCTTPTSRQNCGNWPPPSILIGSPTPPIESLTSSVECAETCCVPCHWTHSRRHWRGAEAPRDPLSAVVVFALFPSNPGLSSLNPPEQAPGATDNRELTAASSRSPKSLPHNKLRLV